MQLSHHCTLRGIFLVCLLFAVQICSAGKSYHIRTNGSSSGTGSSSSAWTLAYGLSHPSVLKPGDTLWVHGGTYTGRFKSYLNGTSSLPIVVRQYPGERAIINGGTDPTCTAIFMVNGTYTWFWGFEIWSSDPDRVSSQTGSSPSDLSMGPAITTAQTGSSGTGCKFINMYIHDAKQGLELWIQAQNLEVYGCLIMFNGWSASNCWGHGMYIQNQTGTKAVTDNIFYSNLGYGIHAYTTQSGNLNNLSFQGNTVVANYYNISTGQGRNNTVVSGGLAPNLVYRNNRLYLADNSSAGTGAGFGVPGSTMQNATIDSNSFIGGSPALRVDGWSSAMVRANKITGKAVQSEFYPSSSYSSYQWDYNSYNGLSTGCSSSPFNLKGSSYSYASWKSTTGKDAHSSSSTSAPTGVQVYVRPNRYERGRAYVTVYNWSNASSISVSASAMRLADGTTCKVVNVQNMDYSQDITIRGGQLVIPMSGWATPKKPNGTSVTPQNLLPRFGTFVVTGVAASTSVPAAAMLSVSPETLLVEHSSGSTTFNVTNDGDGDVDWTASTDQPWAMITDGAAGTNNGTITVNVEENQTGSSRSAVITVTASDGLSSPRQVILTQASTVSTGVVETENKPVAFALQQNYPNPFNPSTTIAFELPKSAAVRLVVYNQLGQEVATIISGFQDAGLHSVVWDASGYASGVYYYRMEAGEFVATKRLLLLK
jgi:hypothetical protein